MVRLLFALRGRRGILYLPLSQSTPGFVRDSLFMVLGHTLRWRVAVHLRGSDFRSYYESAPRLLRRWIRLTLRRRRFRRRDGGFLAVGVRRARARRAHRRRPERHAGSGPPRSDRDPESRAVPEQPSAAQGRHRGASTRRCSYSSRSPRRGSRSPGAGRATSSRASCAHASVRLNGAVTFRPPVEGEEKDRLLASAAILLFPPVEPEGHPRVVLEALAAGVPVVTTDRGAIRETVSDGRDGFVLPDPEPRCSPSASCACSRTCAPRRLLPRRTRGVRVAPHPGSCGRGALRLARRHRMSDVRRYGSCSISRLRTSRSRASTGRRSSTSAPRSRGAGARSNSRHSRIRLSSSERHRPADPLTLYGVDAEFPSPRSDRTPPGEPRLAGGDRTSRRGTFGLR